MRLSDLTDRNVVVWGLGVEGKAAVAALPHIARLARLSVVNDTEPVATDRAALPAGVELFVGEAGAPVLATADVVLKSPGISRYRPDARSLIERGVVTGSTALLLDTWGGEQVVAITGTKGKSATTAVTHHLLEGLGHHAELAGNLGRAPMDLLASGNPRPVVLETSSFQAADVTTSPHIGVLTALFPEHLNWHDNSLDNYVRDKLNLFTHVAPDRGVQFVDGTNELVRRYAPELPNPVFFGVESSDGWWPDGPVIRRGPHEVLPLSASPLVGLHNARNLCAALAVCEELGLDPASRVDEVTTALATYRPLPHRLERLGEWEGRVVVDDGMATTLEAAMAGLATFDGVPVTMFLGGSDKGVDLSVIGPGLASVRRDPTLILGLPDTGRPMGAFVEAEHNPYITVVQVESFADAVHLAKERTPVGGVILLSPGAASFSEFANYRERSNTFRVAFGFAPAGREMDGR